MRLHYLGKSIIQPMDQVHVYISSKSKEDRKIVGGMRSSMAGLSFKQGLVMANAQGIIDSDYVEESKIMLHNISI